MVEVPQSLYRKDKLLQTARIVQQLVNQRTDGLIISQNLSLRKMRDGALKINQDVSIFNSIVSEDEEISFDFGAEPYTRQQVVKGSLKLDGEPLPDHRRGSSQRREAAEEKAFGKLDWNRRRT